MAGMEGDRVMNLSDNPTKSLPLSKAKSNFFNGSSLFWGEMQSISLPLVVFLSLILVWWAIFSVVTPSLQEVWIVPQPQFVPDIDINHRIPGTAVAREKLQWRLECFARKGRWAFNNSPRFLPWYVHGEDKYWMKCDSRHAITVPGGFYGAEADEVVLGLREGEWNVRDTLKYEWQVNDSLCGWQKFDRGSFCRAVGRGRNIMFVGDSLSWEHHITFLNHMNTNVSHPVFGPEVQRKFCRGHVSLCKDVLGGEGFNFVHRRNLYLTLGKWSAGDVWQQDWFDDVERERIAILVLNRGAWYVKDANFTRDLNDTLVGLRDRYPDLLIIFRSTVPGHKGCDDLPPRPLETPPRSFKYNWESFERQNGIAQRLVEAVGGV